MRYEITNKLNGVKVLIFTNRFAYKPGIKTLESVENVKPDKVTFELAQTAFSSILTLMRQVFLWPAYSKASDIFAGYISVDLFKSCKQVSGTTENK